MTDYKDVVNALSKLGGDPAQAYELFGERGYGAWQIVKERRVKKYLFEPSRRVRWIVVGKSREYLIYDKVAFCSCDDFWYAIRDGKAEACQHLIGQKLAVALNMFDVVEETDERYDVLIAEWVLVTL